MVSSDDAAEGRDTAAQPGAKEQTLGTGRSPKPDDQILAEHMVWESDLIMEQLGRQLALERASGPLSEAVRRKIELYTEAEGLRLGQRRDRVHELSRDLRRVYGPRGDHQQVIDGETGKPVGHVEEDLPRSAQTSPESVSVTKEPAGERADVPTEDSAGGPGLLFGGLGLFDSETGAGIGGDVIGPDDEVVMVSDEELVAGLRYPRTAGDDQDVSPMDRDVEDER